MAIEDTVVEREGNGGGSEVDDNRDLMVKEDSNTMIGAIGKEEARWTKMSTMGEEETDSA